MAKKQAEAAAAPPAAEQPKGKRKLLLIAGAAALLIVAGSAGAYMMLGKRGGEGSETQVTSRKMPVFVDLESFTVNLPGDDERFMQVKLVAEVRDSASGEVFKTMMPIVRNEILLLLGSRKAADVATRESKEQLAADIVVAANKPLEGTSAAKSVERINFTHLIVQ